MAYIYIYKIFRLGISHKCGLLGTDRISEQSLDAQLSFSLFCFIDSCRVIRIVCWPPCVQMIIGRQNSPSLMLRSSHNSCPRLRLKRKNNGSQKVSYIPSNCLRFCHWEGLLHWMQTTPLSVFNVCLAERRKEFAFLMAFLILKW